MPTTDHRPPTTDPRIDAYIGKSADFAQPILSHLRQVVHAACPDAEETIKWSMPFFMHGGKNLAHMAAFKAHCAFGFWNGVEETTKGSEAMGQFGRITTVKDLPAKAELAPIVKKAAAMIDSGEVPRKRKSEPKPPPEAPADLLAALRRSTKARKTYEAFTPGRRREYIEWMEDGKSRHWKYADC